MGISSSMGDARTGIDDYYDRGALLRQIAQIFAINVKSHSQLVIERSNVHIGIMNEQHNIDISDIAEICRLIKSL